MHLCCHSSILNGFRNWPNATGYVWSFGRGVLVLVRCLELRATLKAWSLLGFSGVVAERALELNAVALILFHNHPSGNPEPSQADRKVTQRLQEALGLLDNRVLDHVIGGRQHVSLASRGRA